MDHTHYHCGQPRPLDAFGGGEDLAAVLADPAQSGRAGVALTDGVRCDEAKGAVFTKSVEGEPKEVRNEVGVAVALGVQVL